MFQLPKKKDKNPKLTAVKEKILDDLATYSPTDPEYWDLIEHLERLTNLQTDARPQKASRDALIMVAGNLLGILVIVAYEQKHVFVSKASSFIMKAK